MQNALVVGTLLAMCTTAIADNKPTTRIDKFSFVSPEDPAVILKIDATKDKKQTYEVELGDPFNGELTLSGQGLDKVRVTLVYKNFMSIQLEGEHLDLDDWKFYESEELELSPVEGKAGTFPVKDSVADNVFPFVSHAELLEAVTKHFKKNKETPGNWLGFAKKCKAPQVHPCAVSPGQFSFRFYSGTAKRPFKELVLNIPLGC